MKTRGSNTGCGSKHLGEGRSQVAQASLPRLLPLSRPQIGPAQRIMGMRRASIPRGLGVGLSPVRGRGSRVFGVQGYGNEAALSLPPLHRRGGAERHSGSCGPLDPLVYALRREECPPGGWGLARSDPQLPVLRGSHRLREGVLGEPDGRGDGQAAQEGRDVAEGEGPR